MSTHDYVHVKSYEREDSDYRVVKVYGLKSAKSKTLAWLDIFSPTCNVIGYILS